MTLVPAAWKRSFSSMFRRSTPEYASAMSMLACVFLAVGGIVLGAFQQSLILQTNGLISMIDIGNSMLFLAAVRRSMRTADMQFNYGYGKYESLAILASATLLIVLTVYTLGEAWSMFSRPSPVQNTLVVVAWSIGSWIVMQWNARRLTTYAQRFHMPMLHYDAELWRVDSYLELGVLLSLLVGGILLSMHQFGLARTVDGIASILLIVVSLKVPLTHGREAMKQLLDRTLPDSMQFEILAIIAENFSAMCEFKGVHTRQSGKDIFIEIDLVMPYDYTLSQLYELERVILERLQEKFPTAVPRVYVTPCDRACIVDGVTRCPIKLAAGRT